MLNGKYISIARLIEELYRDNGYSTEIPWEDLISWTDDALLLIGANQQFLKKVTGTEADPDLDVTDYRAPLPCDFYKLEQIAFDGAPVRFAGSTFQHLLSGECCGLSDSATVTEIFRDNFGNEFSPQLSASTSASPSDVTFDINNNYMTFNKKEGKVCLAYLAVPMDKDGFPLIPDNISYRKAVKAYLSARLDYLNWRKDPSDRGKKSLYDDSEQQWCWYVGQAGNKAKMPDVAMMESIKNERLRLIPDINQYSNFFKSLGAMERRRLH